MNSNWPMTWHARWIWAAPYVHREASMVPTEVTSPETRNRFCYLRRTFILSAVPGSVPARVTADSRFVLFVNGTEVARGPARSVPLRLSWTELDLTPFLTVGRNTIAAMVRFYGAPVPWWLPAPPSYQIGFGSFAFEAPLIQIGSDNSWKGSTAPYVRFPRPSRGLPQVANEIVDGAKVPFRWAEPDFDDSRWENATELSALTLSANRTQIPVEPFTSPEPSRIAPLTSIAISLKQIARYDIAASSADDPLDSYPESVSNGPDCMTVFDAGGITLATPRAEVSGPAGSILDFYVGEDLQPDGRVEIAPRNYAMRYILGGRSREHIEGFEAVGFRYLCAVTRDGAQLESVDAIERRHPRKAGAYFKCDDVRLNQIWEVGARTLDLCSTDAFIDCPGREQRAWLGDSYIHSLLTFVANPDWRLVRRHLRICAHSRRADGLLAMVAAGDLAASSTTIPDYSLHWIRALARYYQYSADLETVRELAPVAVEILNAFERYRADDGLIRSMPGWMFIDWAMTERAEVIGAIDALYAAALDDYALLARGPLNLPDDAASAESRASRTRAAFELLWDNARGIYVDAADSRGPLRRISQHTNCIAIVAGCAPPERWTRMLDFVFDESRVVLTPTISDNMPAYINNQMDPAQHVEFSPEVNVVMAQPFFSHFLHDALVRAGRRDLLQARCLKWWPQIERGNTTFEEYWDASAGTGSRCHAWSATPTYDLTTHVLGVWPLMPGYAEAKIAPWFGSLHQLEGTVPTPRGPINLILDRQSGGEIAIPAGVVAEVEFADAPLRGGQLGGGNHRIRAL